VSYFRYFEQARISWFDSLKIDYSPDSEGRSSARRISPPGQGAARAPAAMLCGAVQVHPEEEVARHLSSAALG